MKLNRRIINLFYYNIFRFECNVRRVIDYPFGKLAQLFGLVELYKKRTKIADPQAHFQSTFDDPRGGITLTSAGLHVSLVTMCASFSLLNIIAGIGNLRSQLWIYGLMVTSVLGFLISNFVLAPTDRAKYLKDFREFERWPKRWKHIAASLTFLLEIGILSLCIFSFWFYFREIRD